MDKNKTRHNPSYIPTTVKNKALVEQHRDQIVNAAIKFSAKKGYHKTTLIEELGSGRTEYRNINKLS